MPARRLSAAWVVPMEGRPIPDGALLIGDDGRIAAVGAGRDVPAPPGVPAEHFAAQALIPGLVNAHTHLELTGFEQRIPEEEFASWIWHLISLKRQRSADDFLAAARSGVASCLAAGVTSVADTGDSGAVIRAMHEAGMGGVAYLEIFGPDPALADERFAEFVPRVQALRAFETPRIRLGVSPHAPYSVSGPLFAKVSDWARAEGLPVAVHIAESADEEELLRRAGGAFAERWRERGIPMPDLPGLSPVAWLDHWRVLGEQTLCIHAVRVDAADIDRLCHHRCGVAHCPRSNRRHAGLAAPLDRLLAAGLRVGVGTDSVASVSPLDLLAEAREAMVLGRLSAEGALRLCTLAAAEAIGLGEQVGSLRPGKWGDAVVFQVPPDVDESRLEGTLLHRSRADVAAVYIAGRRAGA